VKKWVPETAPCTGGGKSIKEHWETKGHKRKKKKQETGRKKKMALGREIPKKRIMSQETEIPAYKKEKGDDRNNDSKKGLAGATR